MNTEAIESLENDKLLYEYFVFITRFLNRFQQTSEIHKEMLAILSAVTDVIKERNGTQSSTEFFLGLVSMVFIISGKIDWMFSYKVTLSQ